MPWNQTTSMDQKMQFIADYLRGELGMTELCQMYGISRKTGYKFVDRYLSAGPEALEEHSRRPLTHPNQTPEHIVQVILEMRRRHPSWGGEEAAALAREAPSALGSALAHDGIGHPEPSRHGAQEACASCHRSSRQAQQLDPGAQRRMGRRLQRSLQDR